MRYLWSYNSDLKSKNEERESFNWFQCRKHKKREKERNTESNEVLYARMCGTKAKTNMKRNKKMKMMLRKWREKKKHTQNLNRRIKWIGIKEMRVTLCKGIQSKSCYFMCVRVFMQPRQKITTLQQIVYRSFFFFCHTQKKNYTYHAFNFHDQKSVC